MNLLKKAYRPNIDMHQGGRLIQVFTDCDLRCQHDGLTELASKEKIKLSSLQIGEYVAFFNTKRTMVKIAAANGVIASRRAVQGRFYDISCIRGIIEAFHNTGEIDYDTALRAKLEELLQRRAKVVTSEQVERSSELNSKH